jgi:tetratricopeptide (TPR) repeat protein
LTSAPPDAEFAKAAEHHRRGDLSAAERGCRRTLELSPHHFGANYLLGIIALQRGAFEDAEHSIRLALAINPNVAPAHRHHGIALAQLGRFKDALASFSKAIALKPDDAEAFGQRANALQELERFEEALQDYDRAVALKPDFAPALNNRGLALCSLNRLDEGLTSIDRAIALKPDYAAAHKNRGDVLRALKRPADALLSYDRANALNPNFAEAFYGRAAALQDLARPLDAIASYDRALALEPKFAAALNDRGNVLKDLERFDEALDSYDAAVAASPTLAEAWYNRGIVLLELKQPRDALSSYDRAIVLQPDFPEALTSRGMCKLATGLEDTGWSDYEHRWKLKAHPAIHPPARVPLWSGEDLAGRSILLCAEGGMGDVLQFSRYAPLLAQRGANVTLMAPERLHRLLKGLPSNIRLMAMPGVSETFDWHCGLMSVPSRLELYREKSAVSFPYLAIDPEGSREWRQRLGEHGFRIGIAWHGTRWRGGPAGIVGRWMELSELHPLSQIPGVRLISLQKGEGLDQLSTLPAGMTVETLGDDFDAGPDAFVDTVAVMQHCALIVTCDTSIAHLAGALGRPVWIALKHVPEWRWGLEGSTSPWYPTARLFRQKTRGDWAGVFAAMASELRKLINRGGV